MAETPPAKRIALKKSGAIWAQWGERRIATVLEVCRQLQARYGLPRHGNPKDPLADLIFIVLSNRSSPGVSNRVFRAMRRRYPQWEDLLDARPAELRNLLKPLGLQTIRTKQIRSLLRKIRRDFTRCTLRALTGWPEDRQAAYLESLAGVSNKVARCVMMYTLGRAVLPVDAHVFRVAKRLGWVNRKRADQCHPELEALVPPTMRYGLHVDCIAHGRAVCRARAARCDQCPVTRWCLHGKERQTTSKRSTRSS